MSHTGTLTAVLRFTNVISSSLPAFEATIDYGIDAWRGALPYPITHGTLDWDEATATVKMDFIIDNVPCTEVSTVIASFDAGIATFPLPYGASREGFTFKERF